MPPERPSKIAGPVVVAALLHAAIAAACSSPPYFRLNVATSERLFGGSVDARAIFDDVGIYFRYASKAMEGRVPYRDYVIEYPLGAFPFFFLARVFADDARLYRLVFAAMMLLVNAIVVAVVARRVAAREGPDRVPRRLAWYSLAILAFGPLTVARFDFVPALFALLGALGLFSGRNALGGLAVGLGTLVKVFPGAVAGPALAWEATRPRQSLGRGTIACAATVAAGAAGWYALAGPRVVDSLGYHVGRGLEIGSIYAGAVMAWAKLAGVPYRAEYLRACEEVTGPGSALLTRIALPLQAATLLVVAWLSRRAARPADGLRFAAASVLAFIVMGKVLSPQYLIWLLPLMAVQEGPAGRRSRALFLACCAATTAVYPWSYMGLVGSRTLAVVLLNARNLLLVALLALLLADRATEPGR